MYKKVVVARHGGPEVLQIWEEAIPAPGPSECLVKIHAAGVARVDLMMRKGIYPVFTPPVPFCLGRDFAGQIEAVGEGVTNFKPGQWVAAYTEGDCYAEMICLPEANLVSIPDGVDPVDAACLPVNYLTAFHMLHNFAHVRPGERVLFHGAGSGVGTALLQLGALAELEMIGTASQPKHDLLYRLGAAPIDYRNQDFVREIRKLAPGGLDVAFDPIGGRHLWRSFRTLRSGGRLIAYGEQSWTSGDEINRAEKAWHDLLIKVLPLWPGRSVEWYELDPTIDMIPAKWYRKDLETLLELLQKGRIKPIIAEKILLEEVARAHEQLERGGVPGKLVLICSP